MFDIYQLRRLKKGQVIYFTMGVMRFKKKPNFIWRFFNPINDHATLVYLEEMFQTAIDKKLPLDDQTLACFDTLMKTYKSNVVMVMKLDDLKTKILSQIYAIFATKITTICPKF